MPGTGCRLPGNREPQSDYSTPAPGCYASRGVGQGNRIWVFRWAVLTICWNSEVEMLPYSQLNYEFGHNRPLWKLTISDTGHQQEKRAGGIDAGKVGLARCVKAGLTRRWANAPEGASPPCSGNWPVSRGPLPWRCTKSTGGYEHTLAYFGRSRRACPPGTRQRGARRRPGPVPLRGCL